MENNMNMIFIVKEEKNSVYKRRGCLFVYVYVVYIKLYIV